MVEDYFEIFMDDFSVVGDSFEDRLANLDKVLARYEETNLELNWEKCHLMVKEDIVLVHMISKNGIEVDKAKIEVISMLPPPTSMKFVRIFLGHAGFYRRFIKHFSKVVRPLCKLLKKDAKVYFNDDCMRAFEQINLKLTTTPIITSPNRSLSFELLCDASDVAVGAVLGRQFDIDIQDNKGNENQVVDHLSRLDEEGRQYDGLEFNDCFPDEQLLALSMKEVQWFTDLENFLMTGIIPDEFSSNQRKKIKMECQYYYWEEPYLFRICMDGLIPRCVPEEEQGYILRACHSLPYGGHHGGEGMTDKVISYGFYWPTLYKDANDIVKRCDECFRHFNWQVEVYNREIKSILSKTVNANRTDWSKKLDDALWAYRMTYKTPNGMSPNRLVFEKTCHIPVELEHKEMWVLKKLNLYWDVAANLRVSHTNELDEFRYHAYESSSLCKEKIKYLHDKYIWNKDFKAGDLVLLFNSRLRMFPEKLKSKCIGPFEIVGVTPFGALDMKNKNNETI
ncbi:uncharacterized protein [Nicotiana tomentosiformis]|uniref:uncharacterized protein n=1 Tax=Nicotiana tomentosiformis TaxID=4098 RepID=UPI00388CE248